MRTNLIIVFAGTALAACGAPHLEKIREAKSGLIGTDAATLEQCIGEPQGVTAGASGEIWRYSSAQVTDAAGLTRRTPPAEPDADHRACVFDFTLVDGRVARATSENRAGWGFGSIKNCSRLVERCVGERGR